VSKKKQDPFCKDKEDRRTKLTTLSNAEVKNSWLFIAFVTIQLDSMVLRA
jgi:hypothetical protein